MALVDWIESCPSTNSYLGEHAARAPRGYTVAARVQSAGRGQRGNSWEAEPYKNLTFSILLKPDNFPAARQFELSMLVAIAVAETIDSIIGPHEALVKWPNDIYIGDKKICGILIENSLQGQFLQYAIAGIGININQHTFLSDAPNPVSITQITGRQYDLDTLITIFADAVDNAVHNYDNNTDALLERFRARLWRATGAHPFREPGGQPFIAEIRAISPQGPLTLSNNKTYNFKEIQFIL